MGMASHKYKKNLCLLHEKGVSFLQTTQEASKSKHINQTMIILCGDRKKATNNRGSS